MAKTSRTVRRKILKSVVFTRENASNVLSPLYWGELNLQTQQSPVTLDLRLRKTRTDMITAASSFLKSSVFKMLSVHRD